MDTYDCGRVWTVHRVAAICTLLALQENCGSTAPEQGMERDGMPLPVRGCGNADF